MSPLSASPVVVDGQRDGVPASIGCAVFPLATAGRAILEVHRPASDLAPA